MTKTTTIKQKIRDHDTSVPLAIVGLGCLFPKANNPHTYWRNIREGIDAISDVPESHWKPEDYFNEDKNAPDMTYGRRGGFIDPVDFDPLLYGLSPNNIEATDTTQLLGMVVSRQALLDAGYSTSNENSDGRAFDRNRTSVILGVTGTLELVIPLGARLGHPHWRKALADAGVADDVAEEVVQRISESYVPWQENSFPGLLGNVAAGRIANRFDLGGTNCVVDAACASSLSAIHMAALELYSGRSDMAITGGFDTFNDIFMYMCFSKTPALSPTGNSRPFDINGDGTILGEGLGALVLKRLDDAKRDGDKIYAVLKGMGSSSDGRGNAIYAPSANGQIRALKNAYQDADITPSTIELVEAHGTGTRVGDAVEAEALSGVYREDREDGTWCAIGSVKSMIGHTKAAAGVAGLIKIALALKCKVLPPTIKIDRPLEILNPGHAPVYVNTHKRPWISNTEHPRRAAISAFGFGGSNFHCILEEAEESKTDIEWDGDVLIVALSGKTIQSLESKLQEFLAATDWDRLRYRAASSLISFNSKDNHRLVLVITAKTQIDKLINDIRIQLGKEEKKFWHLPDGAFYGTGKQTGKLALLFPGQGSQYPNMLLDLACQFPQMHSTLADADKCFKESESNKRLSEIIYPIPVFTDEERSEHIDQLRSTVNAQPAIGAVSLGALHILQYFGVKADVTAGHSFGELTALCAAGRIDGNSLFKLAITRGELMRSNNSDDKGSMLVVSASAAVLHEVLEAETLDLIIANNNAPRQVVLSGAIDQIDRAIKVLDKRGLSARKLPVSAAFHSSFVSDAEKPFVKFLDSIAFTTGNIPVFANATSEPYPEKSKEAKSLLASQLARPVEFVSQIENMYAEGVTTFIEVGPGNVLTGLVKSILADREFITTPVDASRGKKKGQFDLACTLAQIAAAGHKTSLALWDEDFKSDYEKRETSKPAMTVKLTGANYVKPRSKREPVNKLTTAVLSPAVSNESNSVSQTVVTHSNKNTNNTEKTSAVDQSSLQATRQAIITLQKMQEQTADLHRHYLEGQEIAQQAIQKLIEQQQGIQLGNIDVASLSQDFDIQPATSIQDSYPTESVAVTDSKNETPADIKSDDFTNQTVTSEKTKTPELETLLLEVVSEKTGYPVDMLSLEMSLDTDLGIDSIKRVEILSALHEKLPGAENIQPEDLGTFRLLKHIAEFLVANTESKPSDPIAVPVTGQSVVEGDQFESVLFEVVAEKTGYPVDMLNLEMNLDTDLGIDSIKRVEILSAYQERIPEAAVINPDDLASLQTLKQIVDYMFTESIVDPQTETVAVDKTTPVNNEDGDLTRTLLKVVADKTGYPADMLNLDMNLDTDLGIDSIKRVEILSSFQEKMPGVPIINPDDLTSLQTLQQIMDYMNKVKPASAISKPVKQSSKSNDQINELWRGVVTAVPVSSADSQTIKLPDQGLIGVTDDGTGLSTKICRSFQQRGFRTSMFEVTDRQDLELSGLVIVVPSVINGSYIQDTFELIQHHAECLKSPSTGHASLLACVTGLGGSFGLNDLTTADPHGAAISGVIKTADKEWPMISCRSIDVNYDTNQQPGLNQLIVDELLYEAPLETGLVDNHRFTIELDPVLINDQANKQEIQLQKNGLVIVSGGARGITAEFAFELAKTFQVNLLLLGRSPLPKPEPEWLENLSEEADIKRAILKNSTEILKPKLVESKYREIIANREILHNLNKISAKGVKVSYQSVDIRDNDTVLKIIDAARRDMGPITGIIHGAGVLADRLIKDKTRQQFDDVYSTKVLGLESLLYATRDDDLKIMVMFSSSTGRFGRKGQSDYAAANEVLNKIAQQESRQRHDCRVLSMNWGPWDGGMVTPQLKKIFEREGVGVIPLKAGAKHLIKELGAAGATEIVILGSEPDVRTPTYNKVEKIKPTDQTDLHVAFERSVSVSELPVLKSHIINGKAVVPVALIMEWFAHGAMHNNPGLIFKGVEDLRIFKGITLDSSANTDVQILAGNLDESGSDLQVRVELRNGNVMHASAKIILGMVYDADIISRATSVRGTYSENGSDVYGNERLFHGPDLQGIVSIENCSDKGISGFAIPAPHPSKWMNNPIRSEWLTDPLLTDSAFQLMILWSFENLGSGSLPTRVGQYRQFCRSFPKDNIQIIINVSSQRKHDICADVEFLDQNGQVIASIDGYESVVDASLNEAFTNNQLIDESQS